MTNPNSYDQFFTQLKTKYIRGLVSTSTKSNATSGGDTYYCEAGLDFVDSDGNTYRIPCYLV